MINQKKILFMIFLMTMFSLIWGEKSSKDLLNFNKYLNLDFENFTPTLKPKFWYTGGMGYNVVIDKTVVYSGSVSLRLEREGEKGQFGVATSYFPIDSARGKKIRFSGFIRTENVEDGYAGLWWRVDGKESKQLAFDNMEGRGPRQTTAWKEYNIELKVPEEAININFGVLLVGKGKAWFDGLQIALDGKIYTQVKPVPSVPSKRDLGWIRANAIPLKTVEPNAPYTDLIPLKKLIANRRIVALGEGTHGTSEFFKMKHRIIKFLAQEMGFTVFAIEANMPEARAVNRYVLTGEGDPGEALKGMYFWTWDTSEVLDMIKWMREFNRSGKGKIEFYGFDMQFPEVAMENVKEFIKKADKNFLNILEEQYKKVAELSQLVRKNPYHENIDNEKWYAAAKLVYEHLKANRETYVKQFDTMEVEWAIQEARVVVQGAEPYVAGKATRDKSMAENLNWILEHQPKGTKVVTWAHNGHVSKDFDTFRSMGTYLSKEHGDNMIVFGFAFHEGEYTAVGKNGINTYGTSKSEPGSVEWFLKSSGIPNFILDLRLPLKVEEGVKWLKKELDFRSIGAMAMDYAFSPRRIANEFDALIYIEKSTPSNCFRSQANKNKQKEIKGIDNKKELH